MAVFGIELTLILEKLFACLTSIILGICVYKFVKNFIVSTIKKSKTKSKYKKKKLQTLQSLFINFTKYIIYIFVGLYILSVFGVNVNGIITGLGVSAALIGLAFQDTAKDIIAGISMIADDAFEIGDTVKIDNFMGEVVFVGLRSTKIRNFDGSTMIIANHSINKIVNYNIHDSVAILNFSVAYESDLDEVDRVLKKLAKKLTRKLDYLRGEVEVLGIDDLDESAIVYRMIVPVESMKQYEIQRIMRKEVAKALKDASIKIPYNQIEVHNAK